MAKTEKDGKAKKAGDEPKKKTTEETVRKAVEIVAKKAIHHIPHHGEHLHKINVNVYSLDGEVKEKVTLPQAFNEDFRPDIIRRAVVAAQANRRQTYGPSPVSGLRRSVYWSGKGQGVSRVPRLMQGMRGAQAPNTVGGRPGWGPDLRKDWSKKINQKEKRKALCSALRAVREPEVVKKRGHIFSDEITLPIVVENKAEKMATTKEIIEFMGKLGIYEDVLRSKDSVHVRAGRGKMRNRTYRERKSILIVAGKTDTLFRGARNLSGVEVTQPETLNVELLAPGGDPGRLTIFTESALEHFRKW